jgi:hypothetical protein
VGHDDHADEIFNESLAAFRRQGLSPVEIPAEVVVPPPRERPAA